MISWCHVWWVLLRFFLSIRDDFGVPERYKKTMKNSWKHMWKHQIFSVFTNPQSSQTKYENKYLSHCILNPGWFWFSSCWSRCLLLVPFSCPCNLLHCQTIFCVALPQRRCWSWGLPWHLQRKFREHEHHHTWPNFLR